MPPPPLPERVAVMKRRRGVPTKNVRKLLRELPPPSLVLPARDMERILAMGEAAVPELLSALEEWEGDEERDRALLAILLGEIRAPEAAAPLARLLRAPEEPVEAVAAAEALAKIGAPAVPALLDLTEDPNSLIRLYAYGTLGAIPVPEAYQALLRALEEEPEMAFLVACGVASQGRAAAIPALLGALEGCPPWQRDSVEDAIRLAHEGGGDVLPTIREDWRLRYRLLLEHGVIDPGPLGVAAILFPAQDEMPAPVDSRVRTLEEILAPLPEPEPDLCEECGAILLLETGLPVCPDHTVKLALTQARMLEVAGSDWVQESVLALLEIAEGEHLWLMSDMAEELDSQGEFEDSDNPKSLEEEREENLALIHTLRWLLGQGVETVREGKARLLAQAGILADRFGDPEGLLTPVSPALGRTSAPAAGLTSHVGRNDPCPCGSGRKYKKCCGKGEPAGLSGARNRA